MVVSILTPTLNAERYLGDCLRSIAAQTHPRERIQHVVADGGSSDRTAEVARASGAEVDVARDRSLYDALNRALRLARGDVIGWLNADDVYAPDALERVVAAFRGDPRAEIVVGDYAIDSPAGRRVVPAKADALARIRRGERAGTWITPLAVFYRATTLRALGDWLPQYRVASDLELWIRAAAREPLPSVLHVGGVIGTFRIHDESLSSGSSPERSLLESIEIARGWAGDPAAPVGVRRFGRFVERRYGLDLRMWTLRDRSRAARLVGAIQCWVEQRRLGPGALGDMITRFP